MNVTRRFLAIAIASLLTCACSPGLTGTFADDGQVTTYEFHRDGRATISVLGATAAAEYRVDGDRVFVTSAQGTVVLRRADDRLYGPMGLELIRQTE